jgi:hypothetical protein
MLDIFVCCVATEFPTIDVNSFVSVPSALVMGFSCVVYLSCVVVAPIVAFFGVVVGRGACSFFGFWQSLHNLGGIFPRISTLNFGHVLTGTGAGCTTYVLNDSIFYSAIFSECFEISGAANY